MQKTHGSHAIFLLTKWEEAIYMLFNGERKRTGKEDVMKNLFAAALGHFMAVQERRVSEYVNMSRARHAQRENQRAR